ncbi:MAG TPA: DUF2975 domain-containing protein, partial [Ferruginibacter sp.]|nr:DUF2975 domain-containing protein [Ferruginibacter sp.]
DIIGQVINRPITLKTGDGYWTLAEPGLLVDTHRNTAAEIKAPDTAINYSYKKENSSGSGGVRYQGPFFENSKAMLDSIIRSMKPGETISMDTTVVLITEHGPLEGNSQVTSYDTSLSASENDLRYNYVTKNIIKETLPQYQKLRINAAGHLQRAGFILYDIAKVSFLALCLYLLARLFQNFERREYFTPANVSFLKWAGLSILIIQLVVTCFYWVFLAYKNPVKLSITPEKIEHVAQFSFTSDIEVTKILLGISLVVMSYIFRDGLRLKEQQELTI